MTIINLSSVDLTIAAILVVLMAGCTAFLKLGLGRQIVVAATRMVIQLLIVGTILKGLFTTRNFLLIAGVTLVMLAISGREVMARQKRPLKDWWSYGIGTSAMFFSSFSIAIIALVFAIQPDPWYDPQYAIPILGMLLGNTMNGIALTVDRLTQTVWQQKEIIEQRLLLGENLHTALNEISRDSLRSGMIPIINSLSVAGIVSLPGMMTGQILAGNPPLVAVRYQILIWLLITAGAGFGMIIALWATRMRLFDPRHRLRLERLKEK